MFARNVLILNCLHFVDFVKNVICWPIYIKKNFTQNVVNDSHYYVKIYFTCKFFKLKKIYIYVNKN